jgi:hypothetical protein
MKARWTRWARGVSHVYLPNTLNQFRLDVQYYCSWDLQRPRVLLNIYIVSSQRCSLMHWNIYACSFYNIADAGLHARLRLGMIIAGTQRNISIFSRFIKQTSKWKSQASLWKQIIYVRSYMYPLIHRLTDPVLSVFFMRGRQRTFGWNWSSADRITIPRGYSVDADSKPRS